MGQKVNPIGFRLGVIRSWDSKWVSRKNYAKWLHEDILLRRHIRKSSRPLSIRWRIGVNKPW